MNKPKIELRDFYVKEAIIIDIDKLPSVSVARSLAWNAGGGTGGMLILISWDEKYVKRAQKAAMRET